MWAIPDVAIRGGRFLRPLGADQTEKRYEVLFDGRASFLALPMVTPATEKAPGASAMY